MEYGLLFFLYRLWLFSYGCHDVLVVFTRGFIIIQAQGYGFCRSGFEAVWELNAGKRNTQLVLERERGFIYLFFAIHFFFAIHLCINVGRAFSYASTLEELDWDTGILATFGAFGAVRW